MFFFAPLPIFVSGSIISYAFLLIFVISLLWRLIK